MWAGAETIFYAALAMIFFIIALNAKSENGDLALAGFCSAIMIIFWGINTIQWMTNILHFAILSDSFFTLGALILFLIFRRKWLLALSALYAIDVVFDWLYDHQHVSYSMMAWTENGIYILQLASAAWPGWCAIRENRRHPEVDPG